MLRGQEMLALLARLHNQADERNKERAFFDFLAENMDARMQDVYLAVDADDQTRWDWRRRDSPPPSHHELRPGKRWASPAVPRHVVTAVPIDETGAILFHKRSQTVRSAKGVWSFPTGTLELGETLRKCAERELEEEHGLTVTRTRVLGAYESIAPEDWDPQQVEQYHWVFTVVGCLVPELRLNAKNLEPDKHERVTIGNVMELADARFWMVHGFHRSFDEWARSNCLEMARLLMEMIRA